MVFKFFIKFLEKASLSLNINTSMFVLWCTPLSYRAKKLGCTVADANVEQLSTFTIQKVPREENREISHGRKTLEFVLNYTINSKFISPWLLRVYSLDCKHNFILANNIFGTVPGFVWLAASLISYAEENTNKGTIINSKKKASKLWICRMKLNHIVRI